MAKISERWGYVGPLGDVVIDFQFEYAFRFQEGKGLIRADGRFGFIDRAGIVVVPVVYFEETGAFSEGRAPVQVESGKCGYIDSLGELVIPPVFEMAYPFCDGLACVRAFQRDGKGQFGFVDQSGSWVVSPRLESAANFSNGLAAVRISGFFQYMDTNGAIIDYMFKSAGAFDGMYAPVETEKGWGIADRGMNVQLLDVDYIFSGSNDRFMVTTYDNELNPRFGFIDAQCNFIVPPTLEAALSFSESLAAVCVNGKWGYVNAEGGWVIEPVFLAAHSFSGGLAYVESESGHSYIDRTGCKAFDVKGFSAFEFVDGLAPAYVSRANSRHP